jgi:hypothetical protein
MKSTPRKLRLLIIDDELAMSPGGYSVPESIERWDPGGGLDGIVSWQTAIQFWSAFQGGQVPDLVVADVRFIRDQTSPLSLLFESDDNNIPTGLSHLKTFAILSRAIGTPLGVGTRTMDPGLWERQINSPTPEALGMSELRHSAPEDLQQAIAKIIEQTARASKRQAMGYLAAHEIGEIAAILGDGAALLEANPNRQQLINNCLEWLVNTSAKEFEDGIRKAVRDYRHRLFQLLTSPDASSIFLRPSHYGELLGWCHRMHENPQPLNAQNDFGLELTYYSGKRDLISIASLFADFEGITSKTLDPSSFADEGVSGAEAWKLDDDGRPRIGAFLKRLGSLRTACKDAAEAVKAYQVGYPLPEAYQPMTLAEIKNSAGYSALTMGIVILFQFLRIEQKKVEQWEYSFENDSWEPKKRCFISGKLMPDDSLRKILQRLISLIRRFTQQMDREQRNNCFTREDLFEAYPDGWVGTIDIDRGDHDNEWVKWHFDRLVDAGVLELRLIEAEDFYSLKPEWWRSQPRLGVPPAPRKLPRLIGESEEREPTRVQWLKASLGYSCDDYNSVERMLADAFGAVWIRKDIDKKLANATIRAKVGRAILNNLEEADIPFFYLEICCEYAAEYLNWARETWPKWLRFGPANVENA